MDFMSRISAALIEGDEEKITALTREALSAGTPAKQILDKALMPAMDHVGGRRKEGEMFIPEVLLSARTMKASLEILKPGLTEHDVKMRGKVVLGTVQGDVHDIGLNLVGILLEGAGFEVVNLGKDVAVETFIEAIKREKPDVVGMSALLTTTMTMMRATLDAMTEAGIRDKVKVMIGGSPVTQEFADEIGADGFGADAVSAIDVARRFVGV